MQRGCGIEWCPAMDILYLLIPLSVLLMLAILGVFAWALQAGQFDELEGEGARILEPESQPLDPNQGLPGWRNEESRH
jgi:cbb3-type cytochrome oxidase maturation protein